MDSSIPNRIDPADVEVDLIAGVRQGNRNAIRSLIQRNNRRLYRLARGMVGNDADAEDVLQDAYLRAIAAIDGFRGDSSLETWLTRIVMNEALQLLRRRKARPAEGLATEPIQHDARIIAFPTPPGPPDPEVRMAQREICRAVEQAIDGLPEDFRMVLVARTIEGMSVEETSAAFDLKPETVKTRLHRARHLLRAALTEHIEGEFQNVFPFDGERCQRIADAVVARLSGAAGNLPA